MQDPLKFRRSARKGGFGEYSAKWGTPCKPISLPICVYLMFSFLQLSWHLLTQSFQGWKYKSLGVFLKSRFWFNVSEMGPEILRFYDAFKWCWCGWSMDPTLSSKASLPQSQLQDFLPSNKSFLFLFGLSLKSGSTEQSYLVLILVFTWPLFHLMGKYFPWVRFIFTTTVYTLLPLSLAHHSSNNDDTRNTKALVTACW